MWSREFVLVEPMHLCPTPQVLEEVARVNGVTNVLGIELSQLTTEEELVRLQIEPVSIDLAGIEGHAAAGGIVGELFQAPTIRRSTISM